MMVIVGVFSDIYLMHISPRCTVKGINAAGVVTHIACT
jgi:hypothetical protein